MYYSYNFHHLLTMHLCTIWNMFRITFWNSLFQLYKWSCIWNDQKHQDGFWNALNRCWLGLEELGRWGPEIDSQVSISGGRISLILIADISVRTFVTNLGLQAWLRCFWSKNFEELSMCWCKILQIYCKFCFKQLSRELNRHSHLVNWKAFLCSSRFWIEFQWVFERPEKPFKVCKFTWSMYFHINDFFSSFWAKNHKVRIF